MARVACRAPVSAPPPPRPREAAAESRSGAQRFSAREEPCPQEQGPLSLCACAQGTFTTGATGPRSCPQTVTSRCLLFRPPSAWGSAAAAPASRHSEAAAPPADVQGPSQPFPRSHLVKSGRRTSGVHSMGLSEWSFPTAFLQKSPPGLPSPPRVALVAHRGFADGQRSCSAPACDRPADAAHRSGHQRPRNASSS